MKSYSETKWSKLEPGFIPGCSNDEEGSDPPHLFLEILFDFFQEKWTCTALNSLITILDENH